MSRRLVLALDLVADADLIADYEKLHAPGGVWPGVLAHIRATGVLEMQIWRVDDRMVMVAEVADDYPRPAPPALDEAVARWEALMWRFQKALPQAAAGEKWRPMRAIFDLSQHPDGVS
ncbi:L-rhamnose mutarotase [Niveispirillum sp. KHB5.9]|uniref:L-rhamnose mutarotase n=1 Tax=Niveispirillum sp. KHB5.9 TaxID=3400269 RepID=UPI003A87F832